MKLKFSRQIFKKNVDILNFMKIRPVRAELFHAGGHGEANSCFTQILRTVPTKRRTALLWIECNVRLPSKNVEHAGPKRS
jgi:hypothetical protein